MSNPNRFEVLERSLEEFRTREDSRSFASGIRTHTEQIDPKVFVFDRLLGHMALSVKTMGYKPPQNVSFSYGKFDYDNVLGAAVRVECEKDPNASALMYVASGYESLVEQMNSKIESLVKDMEKVSRSKTLESARKKAKRSLKVHGK